ncbi:MAG: hypothetical protein KHX55_02535 [Proteobacteria bacterium]|nr:hypothetical protein [Pseudomonadota bacterium]
MIVEVPLSPLPSQELSLVLGNQDVTVRVLTHGDYLYLDILKENEPVILGQIIVTGQNILPAGLSDFSGNFQMVDLNGDSDPVYSGLGTQFRLLYNDEA